MKGYKAFNKDLTCRDMQYEVGKTFEMKESPVCCKQGFHFCENIADVYRYYNTSDDTRICEVEAIGEIVTDDNIKYCTNKIKIVKEITDDYIKKCNINKTSTIKASFTPLLLLHFFPNIISLLSLDYCSTNYDY